MRVTAKGVKVAIALIAVLLMIIGFALGSVWIWAILSEYVDPKTPTQRKDLVNIFVIVVASVVGLLTALAAVGNFVISNRNLRQQRKLEADRAQIDAMQSYLEHIGSLLTNHDLATDIRKAHAEKSWSPRQIMAEALTHAVLRRLNGVNKGHIVRFLWRTELMKHMHSELEEALLPIVSLYGADLRGAELHDARLDYAVLAGADLSEADLRGARLDAADLREANLHAANLSCEPFTRSKNPTNLMQSNLTSADLSGADLRGVSFLNTKSDLCDFTGAKGVSKERLENEAWSLAYATMPDGSGYGEDQRPNRVDPLVWK
jgi:uncharacterized protein YjbI with pentapeptide repeats